MLGIAWYGVWRSTRRLDRDEGTKMDLLIDRGDAQPLETELRGPAQTRPTSNQSRFCEINGRTIHYIQTGTGPHLVLIHGIAASLYIWRFMIPQLAKHYTVTALDLPGFGFSSKHPDHDYGLDQQVENVAEF